ncbi:hypothetical protein ES702_04683 [subsurface metagenome]
MSECSSKWISAVFLYVVHDTRKIMSDGRTRRNGDGVSGIGNQKGADVRTDKQLEVSSRIAGCFSTSKVNGDAIA